MATEVTSFEKLIPNNDYKIKAIIEKIDREGDPEKKRPINIIVRVEETGKICRMCTWEYGLSDSINSAISSHNICEITFRLYMYKDTAQFKITELKVTKEKSELPETKPNPTNENNNIKDQISELIGQVQSDDYKKIITDLILDNDQFFKWPAARACHHAFPGGLALHSYNVCVNAMNLANTYAYTEDLYIDYDVIIAGSLLHDIGKLKEYEENGEFGLLGNMMSHLVVGVEMIDDVCKKYEIDQYSKEILKLKHIIVSHHGALEFGSPNTPVTPEAYIVHMADENDASIEAMIENLRYMNTDEISQKVRALNDGRVYKFY